MTLAVEEILATLDRACDAYTFPMLDNGYVYLAATRLTLHRSETDWAVATEVFELQGNPDLTLNDRPLHYMIAAIQGKPNQSVLNERAVFNFQCTQALYRVAETGQPVTVYSQTPA